MSRQSASFSPDYSAIRAAAQDYLPDMTRFLRDMLAIPSLSGQEEGVVRRIEAEMRRLGYRTEIDGLGNVLGFLGAHDDANDTERLLAFDAHIDTVDVGLAANWSFDPFLGFEDDQRIGGRGASDQEGGMAAMLYGGKIMRDLGLIPDGVGIVMVGSVQEEDCDGLCWQYLLRERKLKPLAVISSEPTDGGLYRGHRGRMEIRVEARGTSCHGSAPERGDNAILRMGRILRDLEDLAPRLHTDPFLGQGSLAVSEIFFTSPSRCAVADSCAISIDRRLTAGEDKDLALGQIRDLPSVKAAPDKIEVSLYRYEKPSWTGLVYPTDCYFPTWTIAEDHPLCLAGQEACRRLFGKSPRPGKWTFSTNGVAIAGMFGIPVLGFGPGREDQAHAPDEVTWKQDLADCAAFYAALPGLYLK